MGYALDSRAATGRQRWVRSLAKLGAVALVERRPPRILPIGLGTRPHLYVRFDVPSDVTEIEGIAQLEPGRMSVLLGRDSAGHLIVSELGRPPGEPFEKATWPLPAGAQFRGLWERPPKGSGALVLAYSLDGEPDELEAHHHLDLTRREATRVDSAFTLVRHDRTKLRFAIEPLLISGAI